MNKLISKIKSQKYLKIEKEDNTDYLDDQFVELFHKNFLNFYEIVKCFQDNNNTDCLIKDSDKYSIKEKYRVILIHTLKQLDIYTDSENKNENEDIIDKNGYIWIYMCDEDITNTTDYNSKFHKKMKETCEKSKKVGFYGPIQHIKDNWLSYSNFEEIKFSGLNKLETIGYMWLYNCLKLIKINFNGLLNLKTVGSSWMRHCITLKKVIFTGLHNLESVGYSWLSYCIKLREIIFDGLIKLKIVESLWMNDCIELKEIIFNDLFGLENVGPSFLNNCNKIKDIMINGIKISKKDFENKYVDNKYVDNNKS